MKTIVLIHTTKSTLETYPHQIEDSMGFPVRIYNMYDDFFAAVDESMPPRAKADLRIRRLRCFLEAAEIMQADAVVVACSTISLEAGRLRDAYCIPVLTMDDAMLEAATDRDGRIVVFATSPNPVPAVMQRLEAYAARKGKKVELELALCEEALPHLLSGDKASYKKAVLDYLPHMPSGDRVVLAQGSSAVLQKEIEAASRCPVYASPVYLIEQLRTILSD